MSESSVLLWIADLYESQKVVYAVMSPLKGRIVNFGNLTRVLQEGCVHSEVVSGSSPVVEVIGVAVGSTTVGAVQCFSILIMAT